jgi:hypothetical protein
MKSFLVHPLARPHTFELATHALESGTPQSEKYCSSLGAFAP